MRRTINRSNAVLVSRLNWYSRLARRATGSERTILEARCELIIRTLMRANRVPRLEVAA